MRYLEIRRHTDNDGDTLTAHSIDWEASDPGGRDRLLA